MDIWLPDLSVQNLIELAIVELCEEGLKFLLAVNMLDSSHPRHPKSEAFEKALLLAMRYAPNYIPLAWDDAWHSKGRG
jgi:hypothetical protein